MNDDAQRWKKISQENVFQKYSTSIDKVVYKLPTEKEVDFYIQQNGDVVCTLAITKDNQIILAKQYRPGPDEVLLELPGGAIEPDEQPIVAVERELMEETGYKGNVQLVTTCLDDAYSTRIRYCFVVTECERASSPQTGEHEFVELALLSLDEFRKLLRTGKMTDVEVGYLGLDFLNLL